MIASAHKQMYLSKSKYLSGLQCDKLLWTQYNAKEEIPPVDEATQVIFDRGHLIGEFATEYFPDGIEIECDYTDIDRILELSRAALSQRKPLFEAGFLFEDGFARADILRPVGNDEWDVIEVKSSTKVKPINLHDLAFQTYVYRGAGVKIRCSILLHLVRKYVEGSYAKQKQFFTPVDVTESISKLLASVPENMTRMLSTISNISRPNIPIGSQCTNPFRCPLIEKCRLRHVLSS